MRRLRILVVMLILWLLLFFSIERFIAPINISRVAYPFAPLMALLILLIPGLRRVSIWLLLIVPIPVFLFLKALAGYRILGTALPFTITDPGSYYLTTNLTVASGDAITIATNGVTLDLSGFTISSTTPSATGYGIRLSGGRRNLTIVNGSIQGRVTNNGSGTYSGL